MQLFTNNADSELNGAIDTIATSITLKTGGGAKFPAPTGGDYFLLTLFQKAGGIESNHEILKCTARSGDVLTVVRAQESTTARAFASADPVELRLTAAAVATLYDRANHTGVQAIATITSLQATLDAKPSITLVSGLIPSGFLPSYVDDVLEFANLAGLPATGESGKLYTAIDTGKIYRWSGTVYVNISASPGSTDEVVEGATNQYFTAARVLASVLSGLSVASGAAVAATDTVLGAVGKLQKQSTDAVAALAGKVGAASPTFTTSVAVAGTTNTLTLTGSAAASPVALTATGTDSNIDINLVTKGTGILKVNGLAVGGGGGGSAGGATETTGAVSITLTVASTRLQAVAMTVATKAVILPDATTLELGGALYAIKNTGSLAFAVRNSALILLATLAPGQAAVFYLANKSTAAGVWVIGNASVNSFLATLFAGTALIANATSSTYFSMTAMSATQTIAVHRNGGTAVDIRVLTLTGLEMSAGAVLSLSGVDGTGTSITKLSSTQALVVYPGASNANMEARVLTLSGTTLTAGAAQVVVTGSTSRMVVTMLTATQAVLTYGASNSALEVCLLGVSGDTVTPGPILAGLGTTNYYLAVTPLSATQAVVAYYGVSGYLEARVLSISGTSVTAGNAFVVNAVTSLDITITALSTTLAMVAYRNTVTANIEVRILSVSGTNVSAGNTSLLVLAGGNNSIATLAKLTSTQVLLAYRNNGTACQEILLLTVKGTFIQASPPSLLASNTSSFMAMEALSADKAIVIYASVSGYLTTAAIETTQ